jgi:hypothetical protein
MAILMLYGYMVTCETKEYIEFEVPMPVTTKSIIFLDVIPCNLVEV